MDDIRFTRANKKNRKRRKGRRGPRYWIVAMGAFGAIVAFTVGNSHRLSVAYAAERNGRLEITAKDDNDARSFDFNIPAGTLGSAVAAFQKATGIEVKAENDSILAISSPGVSGSYTTENALKEILRGTGVSFVFRDARTVLLIVQAETATVEIEDTGSRTITSPKYTAPLRDTPQTINVIPREMITQQGATTLRDVLNNVPGITLTAGEGGAPAGDNLTIRGFSARNDIYIDGVRDLGAQSRDPFNMEQVEIVKGPSSAFTGRGSTGGTINLVSKLPNLRRSVSGDVTIGNAGTKRATVDVNLPISENLAIRVNAMGHDSNVAGREVVENKRGGVAPSIMFGMSKPTRVSLSYFYLRQKNISDYGIPWVPAANNTLVAYRDRPAPVPRSTFYGFLGRDKEELNSHLLTTRFEHDFNDKLSIRNQFRYGFSNRDSIATPPRFASNANTVINRELRSWIADDDIFDNQTDVIARFKTGKVEHSAVLGGSISYEKNHRILRTGPNTHTTLFDPSPFDVYPGAITVDPREPNARAKSVAGYAFDSIKFSKFLQFVGGLRWDRFDASGVNTATGVPGLVPFERVDTILSGRAALIFKPLEIGSIYVSYGTSANPSLEGLLYSPADVRTDPEKTGTFEVGTKWELFGSKLLLSSALFRVNKTDARTPSLNVGEAPTLDGDIRVDGFEFSATGNFTRNWQVFAGYTFLDSEIVASNTLPTIVNGVPISEVGKELLNTPRNSFNLWTTYRWDRLFFGGGPRFVGRRYGNNINTRVVESYWVADAMVSFRINKHVDLRLNANNIGDKYYIDRIGGGHIIPGPGRVIMMSSGFSF
jgi:catecholate siderophore receptor